MCCYKLTTKWHCCELSFNWIVLSAASTTTSLSIDHRRTEVVNAVSLSTEATTLSKELTTNMPATTRSTKNIQSETVGKSREHIGLVAGERRVMGHGEIVLCRSA